MSIRRLVLVRHAESLRNVAKRGHLFFPNEEARDFAGNVGDHKIPITNEGRRQARETGAALRERFGNFHHLYHSGALRTIQTADEILAAFSTPPVVSSNIFLRERDAGHAYNMTNAEAGAAFPWLKDYWAVTGPFYASPPGGESVAKVCERIHLFLDTLSPLGNKDILVVTHGITLRAIRSILERWEADVDERFTASVPDNCAVTSYARDKAGRLSLVAANEIFWTPETA